MPKYSPQINTVVSVRLPEIEADSPEEAAKKVLETFDGTFFDNLKVMGVESMQWAEKNEDILIDVVGDTEFNESGWYDYDGNPI